MGHESIITGHICCPGWRVTDSTLLQRHNLEVIYGLPSEDQWPFLTKGMFGTANNLKPSSGLYRTQIIHFGGSFKQIELDWPDWLIKFEKVLDELFWEEAFISLETELLGNYEYRYIADTQPYFQDTPKHTAVWTLKGGPRIFFDPKTQSYLGNIKEMTNRIWQKKAGEWLLVE